MKSKLIKILSIAVISLGLFSSCEENTSSTTAPTTDDITFFSVNDVHGSIEEYTSSSSSSYQAGMSKLNTAITTDPDYNSNSVLLSAGDMFQGSALSNLTNGLAMVDIMNDMKFDAMAIGNHDFDWGVETLKNMQKAAEFPFLGINVNYKDTGARVDFAVPSTTFDKNGIKVGVIGSIYSTAASAISASKITNIQFVYEATMVKNEAKRLKQVEKCDIVIFETHSGMSSTIDGVLSDENVDGCFGGHTHVINNAKVGNKYFLCGSSNTKSYQKMKFTRVNNKYKVESSNNAICYQISNKNTYQATPSIDKIITSARAKIGPKLSEVLSTATDNFNSSQTGKFVCSALLDYAKSNNVNAVASFHNSSGIRDKIYKGNITLESIYKISPFDNEVKVIKMKRSSILSNKTGLYHVIDEEAITDEDATYEVVVFDFLLTNFNIFNPYSDTQYNIKDEVKVVRDTIVDYAKKSTSFSPSSYN